MFQVLEEAAPDVKEQEVQEDEQQQVWDCKQTM